MLYKNWINTVTQISIQNPIKPVSPEEFNLKVNEGGDLLLQAIGGLVIPIVSISILLSIITFIMGGMLHSDKIRKAGAAGIGASALGYFIYLISPYLMGLLYSISKVFQ